MSTTRTTARMQDPKVALDAAIDTSFVREHLDEQLETAPILRRFPWPVIALATSGALGAIATTTAVFVTRRRSLRAKPPVFSAKYTRRFGFGRYRLGRFGTAYIAYTYKLPQVRFALPRAISALPTKFR